MILSSPLASCQSGVSDSTEHREKLRVVTTLFPLYDFTKNVAGERAEVSLLLPPGVEAHSYEPTPMDITKIQNCDLFVFTGPSMEPWVEDLLKSMEKKRFFVVDASSGITLIESKSKNYEKGILHTERQESEPESRGKSVSGKRHIHHEAGIDPHIWLDFSNAAKMVDSIAAGLCHIDPTKRDIYLKNAEAYKTKLASLDTKYREVLSRCEKKILIHAGHFAFGYLAKRYGLEHISAYRGTTPNVEPTPKRIIEMIQTIKRHGVKHIFFEELLNPKVAEAIAKETGCTPLLLHGAHNVTRDEIEKGVDFITLMEHNLKNLSKGLQCQ